MVSWLARFKFFNQRSQAVRPRRRERSASTDQPPTVTPLRRPREGGPDGQVLAGSATTSTTAKSRSTSSVASGSGTPSPALIVLLAVVRALLQGPQLSASSSRAARVPGHASPSDQVTQDNADKLREAVADTGIDGADSPVVTTSGDNGDPGPDRGARPATERRAGHRRDPRDRRGRRRSDISQDEIGASWGRGGREARPHRPGRLPGPGRALHLGLLPRVEDVGRRASSRWPTTSSSPSASTRCPASRSRPATVTGLLTILGFSLYDTVVVFDKVRENTKNLRATRTTYAEAANLAVNQTLVRSINTSIVALIPVGAILYVGAVQLGSGALKDLALALFVGMAAGAYSSIFIATPLLVQLKSSETEVMLAERRRQGARSAATPTATPSVPGRSPRTCRSRTTRTTIDDPTTGRRRRRDEVRGHGAGPRRRGDRPRPRRPAAAQAGRARAAPPDGRSRPGSRARSAARSDRARPDRAGGAGASGRRRPRLPRARGGLQGHHAAARRPRGLHRGRRGAGGDAGRDESGATVVDKVVGMEARGFILAAPGRAGARRGLRAGPQGRQAAARDVRRVLRAGVRRGDPRDAPRRAARRASGCCSSTTCWPPAAPSPRRVGWSSSAAASPCGRRRADGAELPARAGTPSATCRCTSLLTV